LQLSGTAVNLTPLVFFSKQGLNSVSPLLHGKFLLSYTAIALYKTRHVDI